MNDRVQEATVNIVRRDIKRGLGNKSPIQPRPISGYSFLFSYNALLVLPAGGRDSEKESNI